MDKKTRDVMFSKKSDHWATPKYIYDDFMSKGYVDPCPLYCETNNLEKDFVNVKMFINPPYSRIKQWVEFATRHHKLYGKEIVFLVPSRTDTKWFHTLLEYGVHLNFVKGRLNFSESDNAPFPSVFITLQER
jgi:site-specific DNA-methyltransferase (adenine-specific)